MTQWDGFYASFMSGSEGQGFAMFVFANGRIVGADPLGTQFDGSYESKNDGGIKGSITVRVPSGQMVVQGASAGPTGMSYEVGIDFEPSAFDLDFIQLPTPLGPVNVKMQKLRDLGTLSEA